MTVDTNTMISITEANQNFSKVAELLTNMAQQLSLKTMYQDIL